MSPRGQFLMSLDKAQYRYIVTFNTRDFAGVEQFGIQTLTLGEFLALLQEDA